MSDLNLTELFHGKEIAEKQEKFKEELKKIEEENFEFFKSQPSKFPSQDHDRIENHIIVLTNNGRVIFNFSTVSNLPSEIRNQCVDAFKRVYVGATQL